MNPEEINKTLATLTPTEKIVLMLFCEGLKQKEMAKKLGVKLKTIDFHFSNIYGKLGLDASSLPGKRRERWNVIRENYCQALSEIVQSSPVEDEIRDIIENLEKTLVLKPSSELANPRPNYKTLALVREDFSEIEEYERDKGSGGGGGRGKRRFSCFSFLGGIILTALVLVGLWIANQRFHFLPIASANQVSPTLTLGAANDNLTPETTQVPSATSTVEASTNTPSSTPTDTPTITPTPTQPSTATFTPPPPNTVLFSDNFDNGLNEVWYVPGVYPPIAQGQLAANEPTLILVDHTLWENIQIRVDVEPMTKTGAGPEGRFSIIARYFDEENMIALTFDGYNNVWYEKKNGEWNMVPNTSVKGPKFQEWNRVIITIEGAKFYASINGEIKNDFISSRNDPGKTGLMLHPNAYVDNYVISSLP